MWLEDLPKNCPPIDAIVPEDFICFRLVDNNPPQESDFFSHRKLFPNRNFNVSECRARSISVFDNFFECNKIKKLPLHKSKSIIEIKLSKSAGKIKQTGKNKSHYSWWLTKKFLDHIEIK